jgi:hypothetical protein
MYLVFEKYVFIIVDKFYVINDNFIIILFHDFLLYICMFVIEIQFS